MKGDALEVAGQDERERKLAYRRAYYERNREQNLLRQRQRYAANPEKYRAMVRARYAANPEKHKRREERRRKTQPGRLLPGKYGITFAEAMAMREAQGNRCAVCLGEMTDEMGARRWVVDHARGSDGAVRVRGILHSACNQALGLLNDHDPAALRRAADYLERAAP